MHLSGAGCRPGPLRPGWLWALRCLDAGSASGAGRGMGGEGAALHFAEAVPAGMLGSGLAVDLAGAARVVVNSAVELDWTSSNKERARISRRVAPRTSMPSVSIPNEPGLSRTLDPSAPLRDGHQNVSFSSHLIRTQSGVQHRLQNTKSVPCCQTAPRLVVSTRGTPSGSGALQARRLRGA